MFLIVNSDFNNDFFREEYIDKEDIIDKKNIFTYEIEEFE